MSTTITVITPPDCDLCGDGTPATHDGRTTLRGPHTPGPWAFMCDNHWDAVGVGRLGTGFGHLLIVKATT